MVDAVVDERAFDKSKIHATIIEQVRKKMIEDPWSARPPPGGKKWLELVRLDGERFAVSCRWEGDKVAIRMVRKAPRRKRRIARTK